MIRCFEFKNLLCWLATILEPRSRSTMLTHSSTVNCLVPRQLLGSTPTTPTKEPYMPGKGNTYELDSSGLERKCGKGMRSSERSGVVILWHAGDRVAWSCTANWHQLTALPMGSIIIRVLRRRPARSCEPNLDIPRLRWV